MAIAAILILFQLSQVVLSMDRNPSWVKFMDRVIKSYLSLGCQKLIALFEIRTVSN